MATSSSQDTDTVWNDAFGHEVIKGYIEQGCGRSIRIVVIGESGEGKSTLINALLKRQEAKVGRGFNPGTEELYRYQFYQHGVSATIWDMPGFGVMDPKEDKEMMQMMADDVKQVDLVLYCIRMDTKTWPKKVHKETIATMTKLFSQEVWSQCLFVLTFANCVAEHLRHEKAAFMRLCTEWENTIGEQISKLADLTNDEVNIRATPVGMYVSNGSEENNLWLLPDRKNWFDSFWEDATNMLPDKALPALLLLNQDRLATDEPQDQEEQKVPLYKILRNKLDKEGSGFWKYVRGFAELRGRQVPGIGYVPGFFEGFIQFLDRPRRKKKTAQGQQQSPHSIQVTDETD